MNLSGLATGRKLLFGDASNISDVRLEPPLVRQVPRGRPALASSAAQRGGRLSLTPDPRPNRMEELLPRTWAERWRRVHRVPLSRSDRGSFQSAILQSSSSQRSRRSMAQEEQQPPRNSPTCRVPAFGTPCPAAAYALRLRRPVRSGGDPLCAGGMARVHRLRRQRLHL